MTARHPRVPRPDPGRPFQVWISSWALAMKAAGLSDRTVELYVDVARFFAGWLRVQHPDVKDWAEVGRDHLRGFFAWLREPGRPCPHALRDPATAPLACNGYGKGYINNVGRSLQQFFAWYAEEEDLPNPFSKVAVPAAPKPDEAPPEVLTSEHLEALIRAAESGRDFEHRRDAAVLRLFACTGVRLSELALLGVEDVSVHDRQIHVVGKGSRRRTVPFDHRAALALDRYLRVRARHPAAHLSALWLGVRRRQAMTPNGIYQMVVRRGAQAGIKIYPHRLRHTFAHRWLDAGGAEGDLMALAGWASGQMLRHYGRSARSARAQRAYDRIDVMRGI